MLQQPLLIIWAHSPMETNGRLSCKSRQSGPISLLQRVVRQGKHKPSPTQNNVCKPASYASYTIVSCKEVPMCVTCKLWPHGKKQPGWVHGQLCGVCRFSLCLNAFSPVLRLPPTIQSLQKCSSLHIFSDFSFSVVVVWAALEHTQ